MNGIGFEYKWEESSFMSFYSSSNLISYTLWNDDSVVEMDLHGWYWSNIKKKRVYMHYVSHKGYQRLKICY